MTKGYTRVASICIAPRNDDEVSYRASYEVASALVTSGQYKFTSRGRWKRDGRQYWKA